jgi:tRNA pseudouridine38-40 synthase
VSKKSKNLRYFIRFSYNGTNYHGWQYQPNAASVQETMNKAMTTILNTSIDLVGAGRTDTGVHAREMYAHFDIENEIDATAIVHKLNSFLPKDIAVFDIIAVANDAHARFDAKKRTYQYFINKTKDVFSQDLCWLYQQNLDVDLMNKAASLLLDHTDFECFSKSNTDVNTYNCNIIQAFWAQQNNQLVFTVSADRFLRNMVRAIVGTLVNVGLHKTSLEDFAQILASKNRSEAGFSVPAHGLYLTSIVYDYIAPSPDCSGILLCSAAKQKIERKAGISS